MKVTRKIHKLWLEGKRILESETIDAEQREIITRMHKNFGKYQYIYESEKGKISLISLPNYFHDAQTLWEIYCLQGSLFKDVQRFESKPDAVKKIKELLN